MDISTYRKHRPRDNIELGIAKNLISYILKEALDTKIISEEEFKAMDPSDKNPSKLNCNFKIHKPQSPSSTPLVRPIVSGSGSITDNISIYVEHYIKEIANQHK